MKGRCLSISLFCLRYVTEDSLPSLILRRRQRRYPPFQRWLLFHWLQHRFRLPYHPSWIQLWCRRKSSRPQRMSRPVWNRRRRKRKSSWRSIRLQVLFSLLSLLCVINTNKVCGRIAALPLAKSTVTHLCYRKIIIFLRISYKDALFLKMNNNKTQRRFGLPAAKCAAPLRFK